jgi:hypothetical protein
MLSLSEWPRLFAALSAFPVDTSLGECVLVAGGGDFDRAKMGHVLGE